MGSSVHEGSCSTFQESPAPLTEWKEKPTIYLFFHHSVPNLFFCWITWGFSPISVSPGQFFLQLLLFSQASTFQWILSQCVCLVCYPTHSLRRESGKDVKNELVDSKMSLKIKSISINSHFHELTYGFYNASVKRRSKCNQLRQSDGCHGHLEVPSPSTEWDLGVDAETPQNHSPRR